MLKFLPLILCLALAAPAQADAARFSNHARPQGNVDAERASNGLVRFVGDRYMEGGCWARGSIWEGFPAVDCYAIYNGRWQGWYVEYQALSARRFRVTYREGGCRFRQKWLTVSGNRAELDLSEPVRHRHCIIPTN